MPFLPEGYRVPESKGGKYFKPQKGESRVRVLDTPILGYEGWTMPDAKHKHGLPVRRKLDDFPDGSINPEKGSKHFWAVPVWNYSALKVQVWEITQATIQGAIEALSYNKDWGDPRRYDLTIQREGDGLETTYAVIPAPPKTLSQEAREAWAAIKSNGFDITRLYNNGDPFEPGKNGQSDEDYFAGDPGFADADVREDADVPF